MPAVPHGLGDGDRMNSQNGTMEHIDGAQGGAAPESKLRIGILGGTLDPVHNGHLEIAVAAMTELRLDHVLLLRLDIEHMSGKQAIELTK